MIEKKINLFLKSFIGQFAKLDTLLAFVVSFSIYYWLTKKPMNAIRFSILFVIIFLFILNIIKTIL